MPTQQTFELTAPNGKVLEVTGDHLPTAAEIAEIFDKAGVSTASAAQPLPFVGGGIKGDLVDLANRADTEAAAAAERRRNWPADVASRLPSVLQWPVAAGLSLVEPAAQVAGVLSGGAAALRAAPTVSSAIQTTRTALQKPADVILSAFLKKVGGDPEALNLAAARMRLEAARSVARQTGIKADIQALQGPDPTAPHLNTSVPVPPSSLTPQQLAERLAYGRDVGPQQPAPAPMPQRPPGATYANPTGAPPPEGPVNAPASTAGPTPPAAPPDAPPPPAPTAPPAPAPPAPAPRTPAASTWSPQRIRNEVGLAARRAKIALTPEQLDQADALVTQGQSPQSAVRSFATPPKLTATAAEVNLFRDLLQKGLTRQQAMDAIAAQRELAARLGTPSSDATRQTIADRNLTGRWPGPD